MQFKWNCGIFLFSKTVKTINLKNISIETQIRLVLGTTMSTWERQTRVQQGHKGQTPESLY